MIAGGMSVNDLLNITDKGEVAFRELLQCGLLNRMPQSDYFCNLSGDDWQRLLVLAHEQAVTGLCYPAVAQLPAAAVRLRNFCCNGMDDRIY